MDSQEIHRKRGSSSAYRDAISLTSQTIELRARYFRNLVIAVVVAGTTSILWAAFARTLAPLAGVSLLFPLCGTVFYADTRLLNGWRSKLVEGWTKGEIELGIFADAVCANPTIPKDTLKGMLATLPITAARHPGGPTSLSTREVVAAACMGLYAYRADILAMLASAYATVAASVLVSAAALTWQPLLGTALALPLLLIRNRIKRARFESASRRTLAARESDDFSPKRYADTISSMSWDGICDKDRNYFAAVCSESAGAVEAMSTSIRQKERLL